MDTPFTATGVAFEADRRRDAELVAGGYRVMRVTWRRLCEEPVAIVARLATVLAPTGDSVGRVASSGR